MCKIVCYTISKSLTMKFLRSLRNLFSYCPESTHNSIVSRLKFRTRPFTDNELRQIDRAIKSAEETKERYKTVSPDDIAKHFNI